jgi:hypothetical protein
MSFWKKVTPPILLMGLISPALVNCDGLPGIPGADCPALKDGNFANLKLQGSAEVQGQLKGFLEAVYSFDKLTVEMEAGLIASCKELGTAIGMTDAQLAAEPGGGEGAKKVCAAVAGEVKAKISAAGGASLKAEIGEPRCEVDVQAMMDCLAGCGAAVDPGQIEASCEGGEISGKCDAECKGSCTVEAGAGCEGTCGGSCKGDCEGTCAAKDASGKCDGKCEGTCKGECTASCEMKGKAQCNGKCSGGCSAEIKEPSCSGEFKPPSVNAECHMNCTAKTAGQVKCTPPSVKIKVEGKASADLEKLIAALEVSLPKIVNIQIGMGKRLVASGEALVKTGQSLPQVASSAGLEAVACIAMAAKMAVSASASVSVNVEASASVGGSVGGG